MSFGLRAMAETRAWLDVLKTAAKKSDPVLAADVEAFEQSPSRDFAIRLALEVDQRKMDVQKLRALMGSPQ